MSDAPTTTADALPWRFSIRSMLVVVTVVCVLLAPYHWFGGWYLFSALCSCALALLSYRGYLDPTRVSPVKLSLLALIGGLCMGLNSLVFVLHAALNLAASMFAARLRPSPRAYAGLLVLMGIIAYSIFMTREYAEFRQLYALRDRYPETSLEDRLEFENHNREGTIDESNFVLTSSVDAALSAFESREGDTEEYWREGSLARLHNEMYDHFVSMQGFGPARMAGFATPKADLLDYERDFTELPILINQVLTEFSENPESHELHAKVRSDFFRPGSFGHVISSTRTIGFEPHGPTDLKQEIGTALEHAATWQLTRLELVSLLRHDEPRVYVAETIPLMNELEDIPHRALDEFEAEALPQLETQRDTVIEETPDGAVMLGAVRAGSDCLQCHNGPRGKLLGAFRYEFRELK